MKITRTPLALLALAAFAPAFAGDAGSMPAHAPSACQMASCTMDMADMAKAVHDASAPEATGSWYLPTWEEANAASNGVMACDETRSTAAPAKQDGAADLKATGSWYLPTAEEGAASAANPMACCETACPMDQASHAKPTPAENPVDAWYLPS
ncbi:hypothetical protein [Geothrix mesophila]|uniref:hypothetical protein n=1 Tax=Geothrix mesophila TaxID=2922723 RepID=UPI001FAE32C3|nr:hypothetical protein [Geothrix sp. SG198]